MIIRELSSYSLRVCMLEKENDVATGASRANSAIVHAGFNANEDSLKAKLNVEGSKMMEQTAKELGVKYKKNGSLVVGFDNDDRKMLEELLERGNKNGVDGLEIIEADRLKEIEPNITDNAVCALYAPIIMDKGDYWGRILEKVIGIQIIMMSCQRKLYQ